MKIFTYGQKILENLYEPLRESEILSNDAYESCRKEVQETIRIMRRKFRLIFPLGSLVFQNRLLWWYQVQEMLRIEKGGADQMKEELEVYNPLIPTQNSLTATLMLEISCPKERKKVLEGLLGLQKNLALQVHSPKEEKMWQIPGRSLHNVDEEDQANLSNCGVAQKTSTVLFLKFHFSKEEWRAFFKAYQPIYFTNRSHVNHGAFPIDAMLSPSIWESLRWLNFDQRVSSTEA